MSDHVTEELVSAYLDGEVSAEERQLVEQALEASADLQRLYADLQQQRAALQDLPRWSLPDDFSDRVMEEAQRRAVTTPVSRPVSAGWKSVAIGISVLAAILLLSFVLNRLPSETDLPGPPSHPPSKWSINEPDEDVPPSPGDWAEESYVYYVPTDRRPKYSLLVDVSLSDLAMQNRAFEDVLQRSGIQLDPELTVKEDLHDAVMASRFAADVEEDDADGEQAALVEMVYVVCNMFQFEDAYFRMESRRNEFATVQLDLIRNLEDLNVLFQLNNASRTRFAEVIDSPDRRTLAHRLVFNVSLRSSDSFLGKIPTPSLDAELIPEGQSGGGFTLPFFSVPQETEETTPPKKTSNGDKAAARQAHPARRQQAQLDEEFVQSEIVFVLRHMPPTE